MSQARTDGIERNLCRQRHWFGRFKRKSMLVSKAKDMVELTMALFAQFRVNGDVAEIFTLDMIPETILSNRLMADYRPYGLFPQYRGG
jgi:hypothetical protein